MTVEVPFILTHPDFTRSETDGAKGPSGYPLVLDPVHKPSVMDSGRTGVSVSQAVLEVPSRRAPRRHR